MSKCGTGSTLERVESWSRDHSFRVERWTVGGLFEFCPPSGKFPEGLTEGKICIPDLPQNLHKV